VKLRTASSLPLGDATRSGKSRGCGLDEAGGGEIRFMSITRGAKLRSPRPGRVEHDDLGDAKRGVAPAERVAEP